MPDQVKGTEEFFLKLVKYAILGIMGLALVALPLFLIFGAANFASQQAKEPLPAQKAPDKDVTMDGFQRYLQEMQKKQEEQEKFDPTKRKATEQDLLYFRESNDITECVGKFAAAVGQEVEVNRDPKAEQQATSTRIRRFIEEGAKQPGRGTAYVSSLVSFFCKALADPGVIELRKTSKIKGLSMINTVVEYHQNSWDQIGRERQQFEAREQNRVTAERAEDVVRILANRARAIVAFTAAGAAFAVFMLLAIYLILAKIETNMRDINESIRTRKDA